MREYNTGVDISIIIPAINEAQNIAQAVTHAWQLGATEVIVVDGGSDDGTDEIARAHGCQVLQSDVGRGVQQNVGARQATGDILLFHHADAWLDAAAGQQIRAALTNAKVVCGAFEQRIIANGLRYRALERGNAWRVRLRGLAYGDQGIFMRRQTFFDLGQFSEVPIMEDLILMRNARRVGWPILLPGPIHVNPRRWQQNGVVRQTLRNWSLVVSYSLGVPATKLAQRYPRHIRRGEGARGR